MMNWFGPPSSGTIVKWRWRGCIYYLLYHRRCLPFFWPFAIVYTVTEAEMLRRAQPEIEARIMAKREAGTRFLRQLHGKSERGP
jgi:hypothetical protein